MTPAVEGGDRCVAKRSNRVIPLGDDPLFHLGGGVARERDEQDVLGFEVQMELPAAVFISAGGYHHHIGANTWNHRSGAVGGRGLLWFEVIVPETSALNVIRGRITDSQYMITEVDDGISVTGPDEIEIRFHIES